jgi:hypothetical protein
VKFSEREQQLREMREAAWAEAQRAGRVTKAEAKAVTRTPATEMQRKLPDATEIRRGRPKKEGALSSTERSRLRRAKRKAGG